MERATPIHLEKSTHSLLSLETYQQLYQESLDNPATFWANQAEKLIDWFEPWDEIMTGTFGHDHVQWFKGAKLNACYNCIDRHLDTRGNQTALLWEGDDPTQSKRFSYIALHEQVCRLANVLKRQGIKKGESVCLYMPMIPEVVVAMLACARIGAVHTVVFGGFSPEALEFRITDAKCKLVITADEGVRGNKIIPLKKNVDAALKACPEVEQVLVVHRTGGEIAWDPNRDRWFHEELEQVSPHCKVEPMDACDPLFILYTSGSTGKPKGIVHSLGGYLVYVATTFKYIFDYQNNEVYWCGADAGWITGHSYMVYGPLCQGATTLIFEGVPHYPNFARYWEIIDKYHVSIFYTSPTALRALRKEGNTWLETTTRKSLRLLGTVGEPINPKVWEWYFEKVGDKRCPIVDTWWQTETGGIMLSPLPGVTPLKPGAASWPFFGVKPQIVDDNHQPVEQGQPGRLTLCAPWPGMMRTILNDEKRFQEGYFGVVPGVYDTGDGAYQDKDGYFWITGRNDDVIQISGHRIGTEEVESALISHPSVSEAGVVGIDDDIKGEVIYAFVTPKSDITADDRLKAELIEAVKQKIGHIATIRTIQWAAGLPKTRSGKIMRRILRKIANNQSEKIGDISTLADSSVVSNLIQGKESQ